MEILTIEKLFEEEIKTKFDDLLARLHKEYGFTIPTITIPDLRPQIPDHAREAYSDFVSRVQQLSELGLTMKFLQTCGISSYGRTYFGGEMPPLSDPVYGFRARLETERDHVMVHRYVSRDQPLTHYGVALVDRPVRRIQFGPNFDSEIQAYLTSHDKSSKGLGRLFR